MSTNSTPQGMKNHEIYFAAAVGNVFANVDKQQTI